VAGGGWRWLAVAAKRWAAGDGWRWLLKRWAAGDGWLLKGSGG